MKAFQKAAGIEVDGIAGPLTWLNIDEADQSEPLLKKGSKGLPVRRLQKRMKLAGFAITEVNGRFDAKTEAAVKTLQEQAGLVVDGIVGPKTWAVVDCAGKRGRAALSQVAKRRVSSAAERGMHPRARPLRRGCSRNSSRSNFQEDAPMAEPTLERGSEGQDVEDLQEALIELDFKPGKVDGKFGVFTETAVRSFQTWATVVADGIVGELTWEKLDHADKTDPTCRRARARRRARPAAAPDRARLRPGRDRRALRPEDRGGRQGLSEAERPRRRRHRRPEHLGRCARTESD